MCRKGFILVVILFVCTFSFGQKAATKPVVKKPQYVMHVVKFGETLTKISQKYGVTKTDILKANPSLTADNLNSNQILRIPVLGDNKALTHSGTKENELIPKAKVYNEVSPSSGKYHIVEKGETMYAISKLYGIKVEDIQKWNNLSDFNLQLGSRLLVADPNLKPNPKNFKEIPTVASEPKKNEPPKTTENPPVPVKETSAPTSTQEGETSSEQEKSDVQAVDNESQKELSALFKSKSAGGTKITKGTGAPMTTTLGAMESVYFAMHKTLPIGAVIKIKNLVNNRVIFAKVIGKLPEIDENKHIIVRYSLGVKKDLLLQNGKCYLQIEYPN